MSGQLRLPFGSGDDVGNPAGRRRLEAVVEPTDQHTEEAAAEAHRTLLHFDQTRVRCQPPAGPDAAAESLSNPDSQQVRIDPCDMCIEGTSLANARFRETMLAAKREAGFSWPEP